jgi:diketogulonate reductase-like aldo/keto reductase
VPTQSSSLLPSFALPLTPPPFSQKAVGLWLEAGGRRIDSANSYQDDVDVGAALAASNVPRGDLFILSKVGPSNPLGFNDTLKQFAGVLTNLQTTYVDLLLVHWPWDSVSQGNVSRNVTQSSDPLCNHTSPLFDERGCRLSTWSAMVEIWKSGGARAIGVSNYNVTHFQEIIDAGMPLPALTQNPFHLYRSSTQMDVKSFCERHGIVFLGYSPFGVPDYYVYPTPALPAANQLQHPAVLDIAARHNATPAQVLIAWQWQLGVPVNPRSMNQQHMVDNLNAYGGLWLNQSDIDTLSSQPQAFCTVDSYYECAP